MRKPRARRNILVVGVTALVVLGGYVAPSFGFWPPLRYRNTGASMPVGVYVYDRAPETARIGDVVMLREPPGFRLPVLLKEVQGVAGMTYCWRADLGTHTLDDRAMPPPSPLALRLGIPVWKDCRALRPGEVVGYGRNAESYDSRFLGPVQVDRLWGVYRLAG